MKGTMFLASAMLAAVVSASARPYPDVDVNDFEEKTFDQLIDHMNYQDDRTYKQRYWVNDKYWNKETGPVFIYICGEYRCSIREDRLFPFMVGGSQEGLLLALEHRFYGSSQPFDDWSLESLTYLNTEQALADLAYFLGTVNKDNPERQTIVVGGSYPGAMSAWFRNRYPHVAMASWAASAVVQPIADFWQYDNQIYTSTKKSGDWCPESIQRTTEYVTQQALLKDAGMPNAIDSVLNDSDMEIRGDDFASYYADIWAGQVQYGTRVELCDFMATLEGKSDFEVFQAVVAFGATQGDNPSDYMRTNLSDDTIDEYNSMRQWNYQVCTEFGWFQTPSQEDGHSMRSWMIEYDYWLEYCQAMFPGLVVKEPETWKTTVDLAGLNIKGSNTFHTNGGEDPWQWATLRTSDPSLNIIARTSDCTDCGHCADLYTPKDSDPAELKETRDMIDSWINELLHPSNTTEEAFFLQ